MILSFQFRNSLKVVRTERFPDDGYLRQSFTHLVIEQYLMIGSLYITDVAFPSCQIWIRVFFCIKNILRTGTMYSLVV